MRRSIFTVDLNENKVKDISNLRPNHSKPHGMQMGPKNDYLYVTCESNNGQILKIDTDNNLEVNVIPYQNCQCIFFFVIS